MNIKTCWVNMLSRFPKSTFSILLAIIFYPAALCAEELVDYWSPVRSQGMGGAGVAIASDQSSIWVNPAGIARIRKARSLKNVHLISFPNTSIGANAEGRAFYNDIKAAKAGEGEFADNIKEAITATGGETSKPLWAQAESNPIIFFEAGKNAPTALGVFSTNRLKLVIDANEPDRARIDTISDVGANLGVGFTGASNRLNFGLQIRPTTRYAFEDKIPIELLGDTTALKTKIEEGANTGSAVAVDTGFIFTFADFWFPSIGVAVFNLPTGCREEYLNPFAQVRQTVCGTVFQGNINNPEALSIVDPTDLRVGLAITPRLTQKLALRFALDIHHIYFTDGTNYYGLSGVEVLKQLHGGVELFAGNPLLINPVSVRVGYGQGFVSFGASLHVGFIDFEIASFGQDISSTSTPREDRRTMVTLSFEI